MTAALTVAGLFAALAALVAWVLCQLDEHPGTHQAPRPVNGRLIGDQPRADQRPGKQPWLTEPLPKLPPEPAPEQDRYPAEEFLDLPVVPGFMRQRGDWGTMPGERVIAAELPTVIA